jgi:glutamyl-tRNA reductase
VEAQATVEDLRQAELQRSARLLQSLSPEQQAAVEQLTRGLMNKFMHLPLQAMKGAARDGDAAALETIRAMFGKEEQKSAARETPGSASDSGSEPESK